MPALHTVFSAECSTHFDWYAIGVAHSFKMAEMPGKLTRLLACDDEALAGYRGLHLMPTFVHANHRRHPSTGDESASYNKPGSVMDFVRSPSCVEPYVLFVDSDMIFTRPIDVSYLGVAPGVVVSERVPYLVNTSRGLAPHFIDADAVDKVAPVGWYHVFHAHDLSRIAPLWLKYCGEVRTHPERYWVMNGSTLARDLPTGDVYVERGKPPWISEMHGYTFAAATVGVDHVVTDGIVAYPSHMTHEQDMPPILHYGLPMAFEGQQYEWSKTDLVDVDIHDCSQPTRYIGAPPMAIVGSRREEAMRLVINTLNEALYEYRLARCGDAPRPQRTRPPLCYGNECCGDRQHQCWKWALRGECQRNEGFMRLECGYACGWCRMPAVYADAKLLPVLLALTAAFLYFAKWILALQRPSMPSKHR